MTFPMKRLLLTAIATSTCIWIAFVYNLDRTLNFVETLHLPLSKIEQVNISSQERRPSLDIEMEQGNISSQERRPPVDVVMGVAVGYAYNKYQHVIQSFERWQGPNQALVLFTAVEAKITSNIWCVDYHHFYQGDVNPIVKKRFYIYEAFVTSGYADRVLGIQTARMFFIDVRDSFFQGDVFTRFVQPGIHLFAENYQLEFEPVFNKPWIRDCGGQSMLDAMIRDKASIANGGVWAASNTSYLERFVGHLKPMLEKCNDQAAMSILGYTLNISTHSAFLESWVTHLPINHSGGGKYAPIVGLIIDDAGRLCGFDRQPYALVHQGDRWGWLWNLRLRNGSRLP